MIRTPVESSNLAAVGYDANSQILQVEFKNGSVYNYFRVPAEKHAALMAADSVGKYLNAEIKPHHAYELLDPNDAAHELASNQQQLDMDGVIVGVSRQALDEVMRDLHFLRFFHQVYSQSVNKSDEPIQETYQDHYGWPAPRKYHND